MNKTSSPHVSIIVLNWNGRADTVECIESINKVTYPNYSIIVVDNGSTDNSENTLRQRYPEIKIIQTGRNLGFAGGMNAGLRHALATGSDFMLLLNNDTIIDREAVVEMAQAASSCPNFGMLSSKLYYYDRPDILWYAGATFNPLLGWGRHRGFNERDVGQYDVMEETGRPCGCAMMVTREFCKRAGLLNEDFFCYGEEVDWCLRGKKAGFKIMYVPSSKVWHKISSSTGGAKTLIYLYYSVRNTLKCIDDNVPLPLAFRFLRYKFVISIFLLSLFSMKSTKFLGMKRIYQGVRDYFRGHMGEFSERQ